MLEQGIVVGIALLVSLAKMNWRWKMRVLSNPLLMDVILLAVLLMIHWGTFSGVMIATFGALTASLVLSTARWLYGFMKDGTYLPGWFDMSSKLV